MKVAVSPTSFILLSMALNEGPVGGVFSFFGFFFAGRAAEGFKTLERKPAGLALGL